MSVEVLQNMMIVVFVMVTEMTLENTAIVINLYLMLVENVVDQVFLKVTVIVMEV